MERGTQLIITFIAGGYFGLFFLFLLLVNLAGLPDGQRFTLNVTANRHDASFVDTVATMIDLQALMYTVRGLLNNGAIFALIFAILFCLLSQLFNRSEFLRLWCGRTFFLVATAALRARSRENWLIPGTFCVLAVLNAYLCHPVTPLIFIRWLFLDTAVTTYFFAGVCILLLKQQLFQLATDRKISALKFGAKSISVFLGFGILSGLWLDMNSPIANYVLSDVRNISSSICFGTPGTQSYLPDSFLIWDQAFVVFTVFAVGAVQVGAIRLCSRSLSLRGHFFAPFLFTKRFVLSSVTALCTSILGVVVLRTMFLPFWTF